jgi:hypothetical protein
MSKLHIDDLPDELQKKLRKRAGVRNQTSKEVIKRHAVAVCALLLDERELPTKDAKRVLQLALRLL